MRSVSKWPGRVLVTAGAFAIAMLVSSTASAQTKTATCDFVEIKATSTETDFMDKALPAKVRKQLAKPPFKGTRNHFELWGKQTIKLAIRKAQSIKLAVGKAEVMFRKHTQAAGKKDRIQLSLNIDDENGSRVLETKVNVDVKDFILVGRSISADVDHVIAVSCTVK